MIQKMLMMAMGFLCLPLFAAYQYEVSDKGINISSDLSLSMQITENNLPLGQNDVFGYYAYNPETPEQYRFEVVDMPKKGSTGTISLGDFTAGTCRNFIKKSNHIYDTFSLKKTTGLGA